jgi:hypothetical protein
VKYILRVMVWIVGLPALLILGLWIAELIHAGDPIDRKPYYTEQSPDGRYKIVVVYEPELWSYLRIFSPGRRGGGDFPGLVILLDEQNDEIARAPVEAMETVPGAVRWMDDRVDVVPAEIWMLPSNSAKK